MDDVGGYLLGPLHDKTPAAVTTNKNIKMNPFKSGERIRKKECGPDRYDSNDKFSSVTLNELAIKAR